METLQPSSVPPLDFQRFAWLLHNWDQPGIRNEEWWAKHQTQINSQTQTSA